MDRTPDPTLLRFTPAVTQWLMQVGTAPAWNPSLLTLLPTILTWAIQLVQQQGLTVIDQHHIDQALAGLASEGGSTGPTPLPTRRHHLRSWLFRRARPRREKERYGEAHHG
jgi:hypothetical protein